jgi:hypothetical protein
VVSPQSPGCRAARQQVEENSSGATPPPRRWGVGHGLVVASLSSGLRIWICQVPGAPRRGGPAQAQLDGTPRQRRPDWALKTSWVVLLLSRTATGLWRFVMNTVIVVEIIIGVLVLAGLVMFAVWYAL